MRVTLNGYVVNDDDAWIYRWFGYRCFSPAEIRDALEHNPEGEDLVFEINSPGGEVIAGNEMYSVLRASPVNTVAEIQSLAASAASYLSLGCRRVMISPVAQMMIHLPSGGGDGDYHFHEQQSAVLRSIGESILNAYEVRCAGKTKRAQLREMMEKETWLCAQDALAAGLVDGILYQEGETPLVIPSSITNAVGGGIRAIAASGGLPSAAELRAKYEALQQRQPPEDAEKPAEPGLKDDWRNEARLSIERARFI